MNETAKTVIFVVAAVASIALALITVPTAEIGVKPDEQIGQPLFQDFKDPLKSNGLQVVTYNQDLGEIKNFKVAQQDQGVWAIPSHDNYPADAKDRLEEAATMFVDLEVINVQADDSEESHVLFGVVEPDAEKVSLGDEGVGTLVTVYGNDGESEQAKLAELIIGKEVKDSEGHRYARLPGQSRVYELKIDPTKFSTTFEDWIETDLLNLNPLDIESITTKDYSVEIGSTLTGRLAITKYDQRLQATVSEDAGQWKLDEYLEFADGELRPASPADDEILNEERLNTLRDSLDELKIVDVERKPKGLGADLKGDKGFMNDEDGMRSLVERGFYPVPIDENEVDLWSSDGELLIDTKDGVQYVLRFGQIAGVGGNGNVSGGDESGLNRFLFVSVQVNEDKFPVPELQPLPTSDSTEDTENTNDQSSAADNTNADDSETASETSEQDQPEKTEEDDADDSAADSDNSSDSDSNSDSDNSDAESDSDAVADPNATNNAVQDDVLAAEIARINRENQRLLDKREEDLQAAKDKVAELNYRFADWYYIIGEDVFRKVRLGRSELFKVSEETTKTGSGLEAFRGLEKEGLMPIDAPANGLN